VSPSARDSSRLDEDDVRVRPGRGKSRPRSKDRPQHESAVEGFVVAVDRGRFTCVTGVPSDPGVMIYAVKSRELGRKGIAVGDRVGLIGDLSGTPDTLARLVRLESRRTVLRRTADDTDPVERVLVANADQLAIVSATVDPEPRPRIIDRALVAAYDGGVTPLLIVTKADLRDPRELTEAYDALEVPVLPIGREVNAVSGLDAVRDALRDKVTVFVGQSGVGKSTLVNALVPDAHRATGHVNDVTGRGRHTSSSAVALELPGGGWVVDTPGVRSFGLAHVDPHRVILAFPELGAGTAKCPRGCGHEQAECGLDAWVTDGHAGAGGAARLDSLRRLLHSRSDS